MTAAEIRAALAQAHALVVQAAGGDAWALREHREAIARIAARLRVHERMERRERTAPGRAEVRAVEEGSE
jgi:FtsP/CotA-like multicopper oxidase with cupredoxin domain